MKKLLIALVLIMTAVSAGAYTDRNFITGSLTKDELGLLLVKDRKYTRQTFSNERYSIWSMQSGWHSLPQINGVDQRYGRKYKAADAKASRGCFEVNIAGAYPEEAAVKSWVRRYDVKDLTLKITDRFELIEAKEPNVINFMTWGAIDASKPGVVSIDIKGHKAQLFYDASKFDASVTAKELPDPRLSNVWGSKVERISLTAKKKQTRGAYTYTIKISK